MLSFQQLCMSMGIRSSACVSYIFPCHALLISYMLLGQCAVDAGSSCLHKLHQYHVMHCMCWMHPTSAESLGFPTTGVVVYNFVEGGVHMAQTSPLHLHSLPVTFGLSAFVYSGHAVFPSIYRSMKDRSQYPRMLDTTYAIVGITGAFMGEPHMPLIAFCGIECCKHCTQVHALCMQCSFESDQLSGCQPCSLLGD